MVIRCRVCQATGSIPGMRKHVREEHPEEYKENLDLRAKEILSVGPRAPRLLEAVVWEKS